MITVLVVDDSAFYRVNFLQQLSKDPEIKVLAAVKDGDAAIDKAKTLDPDVITIDFNLAGKSGIEVIKKIMKTSPKPIIAVSTFKDIESELALTALESGIFDFVEKPDSYIQKEIENVIQQLIVKIKAAASKNPQLQKKKKIEPISVKFHYTTKKILLVASSTGGPQTLERFIPELPENTPCPVLIVQHMPPIFTRSLAERLDKVSQIRVKEAADGEEIKQGYAYIAPGDYHMELNAVTQSGKTKILIQLNQDEKEEAVRPCANRLFRSAVSIYKENTIAVVLTGMGSDGTTGSLEIKKYKGSVIAQSERTSIIYGMPRSVIEKNLADEIVDIDKMAVAVIQLLDT